MCIIDSQKNIIIIIIVLFLLFLFFNVQIERVEEEQSRQQTSITGLTTSVHNDQIQINNLLGDVTNLKTKVSFCTVMNIKENEEI